MLNRHINLPTLTTRTAAALVDFVIFVGLFLLASFVLFDPIFTPSDDHSSFYYKNLLLKNETLVNSGLFVKNSDNYYTQLNNGSIDEYKEIIEKYYLTNTYFDSEWYIENGGSRSPLTIEEYNSKILLIGNDDSLFEYATVDGTIDKSLIGVYDKSLYIDENKEKGLSEDGKASLLNFYITTYKGCFSDLFNDKFYLDAYNNVNNAGTYQVVVSMVFASVIPYLIVPLLNKKHFTAGRAIFKIGISNHNGFEIKFYQLIIRGLPPIVLSLLPLLINDLFALMPIYGGYIFISIVTTIILKDKTSLPDLISFTRLVDLKSSSIYKDELDMVRNEDEYE